MTAARPVGTVARVRSLFVLTALCFLGCSPKPQTVKPDTQTATAAAPMTHETRAFTADLVDEGAPMPPGMERKVTVVGTKTRMELTLDGRQSVQIYKGKGQPLIVLDPANKTYAEMPPNALFEMAATAMDVPNLENPCAAWRSECTKLGETEVDGRKVMKWTTTNRDGATVNLFVDESLFHLLRIEEGNAIKALKNVKVVTPDESWFAIPDGYTRTQR